MLDYFNDSKKERYKIFNDILKYSQYLGFTPDKIFPYMKETEVFEEDGYFWWVLLEKDNLSDYDYYKEIWFWENLILAQIMLDSSSKIKSINHYTTSAALQFMLDSYCFRCDLTRFIPNIISSKPTVLSFHLKLFIFI